MAFQRAQWHSGLTYQQTCENCGTVVKYDDYKLDFRPWYADGFVYCPNCKTPLRHNENYAIDRPAQAEPVVVDMTAQAQPAANGVQYRFCPKCGKKYNPAEANFCTGCGNKLN